MKMKKLLSLLLVTAMLLSLAACDIGAPDTNKPQNPTTAPTDAPTLPSDEETTPEPTVAEETTPEPTADEANKTDDNTIGKEFKAAMDSYEKFIDEYVTILKKYQKDPTDLSILTDYAKYMGEYADMMQKFEKWENEDLNAAETAYYLEVQTRVTKKLLEVAE